MCDSKLHIAILSYTIFLQNKPFYKNKMVCSVDLLLNFLLNYPDQTLEFVSLSAHQYPHEALQFEELFQS